MALRVRDVMSTDVETVGPFDEVQRVLAVLRDAGVRHVPVVDADGTLLGLVTDRDLAGRAMGPLSWFDPGEVDEQLHAMRAREVMTDQLVTVGPDEPLAEAAAAMIDRQLGCLPVVEGGRLVGILTEGDFVRLAAGRKQPREG